MTKKVSGSKMVDKQKLNALLHLYDAYSSLVICYLEDPKNSSKKELNIFYLRELAPSIIGLVRELQIENVLPKNLIMFDSLLRAEKHLQDHGKDREYVRIELDNVYGKIKEMVEEVQAISQPPISKYVDIVRTSKEFIEVFERAKRANGRERTNLLSDVIVGPLKYTKEGMIYYGQKSIDMRFQLKSLCLAFMQNHKKLIDYSTLQEEVMHPTKIVTSKKNTINKYASELHNLLKQHFKHKVIFNDTEQGYIFDIEKDS